MKRIAIIGGGITGLSTAVALKQFGIASNVFESHTSLRIEGAGVWMQPNALAVFNFLNIDKDIKSKGKLLHKVEILNGKNLKSFQGSSGNIIQDTKSSIVAIHRGRLLETLYSKLDANNVHFSKRLETLVQNKDTVSLKFEDGTQQEFDIVLGADGIHSNVRKSIFENTSQRYSGQTCWRGIANFKMPKEFLGTGNETWYDNKRFGFSNINNEQVYWFAVEKAIENQKDDQQILKDQLLNKFSGFHSLVNDIITATPNEYIFRNDITDLNRLKTWSNGMVCLLGDAAHATTPNMGQGACQGIEDAYFIAHYLKESSLNTSAFVKYESKRRKKVDTIVNQSWQFGQMAHNTLGRKLSILLMKLLPASMMQKQLDKIYKLEDI